jgi:hypothetical protein
MVNILKLFKAFISPRRDNSLAIAKSSLDAKMLPVIVSATDEDSDFLVAAYTRAASEGTVAQTPDVRRFIAQCLSVSKRDAQHTTHLHPFIAGQPATKPIDDIFMIKVAEIPIGVLWLRDHNDRHLAAETFGELIFVWFLPELRGFRCWPHVDEFAKRWVENKKKTYLVGRCLKPSRRMAELFERSSYQLKGVSPTGMSVHLWRPPKKSKRWA